MSLNQVIVLILLISAASMAGCTGSSPVPVTTPAPAATAAPAGTPAAWRTEAPAPDHATSKTLSFHGMADYEDLTFTTDSDATWVCDLTYPKEGIFRVVLKNARGEEIQVLADGGGSGTGRKSVWLKAGDYSFDIKADAPWYITMKTG